MNQGKGNTLIQRLHAASMTPRGAVLLCTLTCVMTALMGSDWPGAIHPAQDGWAPSELVDITRSVLLGFPVPTCLLASWMLGRMPSRTSSQRAWRAGIVIVSLAVGLLPLWSVNRFYFYRLGTPGFLTPFALSIGLFAPFWNMSVKATDRVNDNIALTIIATLWVVAFYVCGIIQLAPFWPMVLPLPVLIGKFYNSGHAQFTPPAPYLARYLWLISGSTAIALTVRVSLYLIKFHE